MHSEHLVIDSALTVRPILWSKTERMMQSKPIWPMRLEELMQFLVAEDISFCLISVEKPDSGVTIICIMQDGAEDLQNRSDTCMMGFDESRQELR